MAFQIKDFVSVTASAINWMRTATQKVTDFNIGSVVRTMIEAVAAEIDELYQQMFIGLREAIPVSVYNTFDFTAIAAVPASGIARVVVTAPAEDLLIAAGTTFTSPGKTVTYTSTQDVTIAAGNTSGDVFVVASAAGVTGNLLIGAAFTPSPSPDGFVSASALAAFVNGLDAETEDQRKLRFASYIAALSRGTNTALSYGLGTVVLYDGDGNETERVTYSRVVEPWLTDSDQPVGLVNCYIHNGSGSTSIDLVSRAAEVLYGYYDENGVAVPGWKAAGVNVQVYAATEHPLTVRGEITAAQGYVLADLITTANTALTEYLNALGIGASAILAEMVSIVMSIEGVYNFVIYTPTIDTVVATSVKIIPGTVVAGSNLITPPAATLAATAFVPVRIP